MSGGANGLNDAFEAACTPGTVTGNANQIIAEDGVNNEDRMLGNANNSGGELNSGGDFVILKLADIVPSGNDLTIPWADRHNNSPGGSTTFLQIAVSFDNVTYTTLAYPSTTQTSGSPTWITNTVTLPVNTQYVRFDHDEAGANANDYYVDAVAYSFNDQSCNTAIDTDFDGIANYLDLDSDNDGITDNREAQGPIISITLRQRRRRRRNR